MNIGKVLRKYYGKKAERISVVNLETIKHIEKEKKVFCIGMSKTGTTSMGTLFEDLQYRVCRGNWNNNVTNFLCSCYHYGDVDEIINITKYFDAFEDAPWGGTEIYKELVEIYPKAYFILTYRDTDKWYKSYINMYLQFDGNLNTTMETMRSFGSYGNFLFFRNIFVIDNLANNENKIKDYYNNYNEEVRAFFKEGNYNFLDIDITKDNISLNKISNFLNKKIVNTSTLPHSNKGYYK